MADHRRVKRRHLYFYLSLHDRDTDEPIGRLGDVNEQGLLLLTDNAVHAGDVLHLSLDLGGAVEELEGARVEAEAVVRWSGFDMTPASHCAGLEFVEPSDELRAVVAWLIEEIGFRDLDPLRPAHGPIIPVRMHGE